MQGPFDELNAETPPPQPRDYYFLENKGIALLLDPAKYVLQLARLIRLAPAPNMGTCMIGRPSRYPVANQAGGGREEKRVCEWLTAEIYGW